MKEIYLDNAAATPIDTRVLKIMNQAAKHFGNPSSFNYRGRLARADIESARLITAEFLHARADEIIYTGSGSEANNLALNSIEKGTVLATPIEHPSVLEPLNKNKDIAIKYIPVNSVGLVAAADVASLLSPEVRLVSVMYANNEIGTVQPIRKIAKLIATYNHEHKTNILFHVDACQATGFLDMNTQHLGVDLLTLNGSKIYGPRGLGVLYVRRGTKLNPITRGGSQERGLRAGTENGPAIIGLVQALALIKPAETKKIAVLRDRMIHQIEKEIPEVMLTGPRAGENRLANSVSICVADLDSENLLLELDKYGIAAGSGSACTSHSVEPSHVLKSIGVPTKYINGALRLSLGRETTKKDIDYVVKKLSSSIKDLQKRYAKI